MATTRLHVRPSSFALHVVNPLAIRLGFAASLAVRGRVSGRLHEVAISPIEHGGIRYLVSIYGESDWVCNLRAERTAELHHHGRLTRIRATEVFGTVREFVIRDYQSRQSGSLRRFFELTPDPNDHPVFRIDPIDLLPEPNGRRL